LVKGIISGVFLFSVINTVFIVFNELEGVVEGYGNVFWDGESVSTKDLIRKFGIRMAFL
jgi:hypothetical protein